MNPLVSGSSRWALGMSWREKANLSSSLWFAAVMPATIFAFATLGYHSDIDVMIGMLVPTALYVPITVGVIFGILSAYDKVARHRNSNPFWAIVVGMFVLSIPPYIAAYFAFVVPFFEVMRT